MLYEYSDISVHIITIETYMFSNNIINHSDISVHITSTIETHMFSTTT